VDGCRLANGRQLKLRLKTLVDKKKLIQARDGNNSKITTSSKVSTTYITLREGFQQFEHDLSKLQQFVEINATAFSKILKKVWCAGSGGGGGYSYLTDGKSSGINLRRYACIYGWTGWLGMGERALTTGV